MSRKDLNYQLKSNGNVPLDYKETPVNKVSDLEYIPMTDRFLGMTVTVLDAGDGKPADYWYVGETLYTGKWEKKTFGEDGSNHVINGENPDNVNVIVNGEGKSFTYSNDKFERNGAEIATTDNIYRLKKALRKKKDRGGRVVPSHTTLQYPFIGLGDIALVTPKSRRIFKMIDGNSFDILTEGIEDSSFFYQIDGIYEDGGSSFYGIISHFDRNTGHLYLNKSILNGVFMRYLDYGLDSYGYHILVKDDGRQVSGCGHIWYNINDASDDGNDYIITLPPRASKYGGSNKIKVFIRLNSGKYKGHIVTNRGGLYLPKIEPCYGGQLVPVQRHNMFYSIDGKVVSWMPQGSIMPLRNNLDYTSDFDTDKWANRLRLTELARMLSYNTHQIWMWTGPNSSLHSERKYRTRNYHFAWRQLGRNRKGKVRTGCFYSEYAFYNPKDGKLYEDIRSSDGTYVYPKGILGNYFVYKDEQSREWYCANSDISGFVNIDSHDSNTINNEDVAKKVIKNLFNRRRITLKKMGSYWTSHSYLYIDFAIFKNTKKGKWGRDIPENIGKVYRLIANSRRDVGEWVVADELQYRGTIVYFKNRR